METQSLETLFCLISGKLGRLFVYVASYLNNDSILLIDKYPSLTNEW